MILDRSQRAMVALKEQNDRSASFAQSVSQRYERFSRSMAEVVMSLQFHDITGKGSSMSSVSWVPWPCRRPHRH
jgi:hypothetical protein